MDLGKLERLNRLERLGQVKVDNERNVVAFLDILGFKNHVKQHLDGDTDILANMRSAYKDALNSNYVPIFEFMGLNIQYKQFSDCTCLSIPNFSGNSKAAAMILSSFIYLLREFYFSMLKFEIYIRGGLSVGFHYEDDNMIFSEGLIMAHELESKAMYPRIILDDMLIKRFEKLWIDQKDTLSLLGVDKMLISDGEGIVFINPFNFAQVTENMSLAGHVKKPSVYDESKDLKTNLVEIDHKAHMRLLKNLENKIEEYKENNSVLRKYIWLKELVKWNINLDSSKIKFEYLLK